MHLEAELGNPFNSKNPDDLGDPNDKSLRKVEVQVLIPRIMRDRAKQIHCSKEVQEFEACCKANSLIMVFACRNENSALKSCLSKWYNNDEFKDECKQIYLEERSEYRRTGVPKKRRIQKM
ncbi:COX assembly mitochondrial protein homolog [Rhagoletis pomonella]|uniref:COX assembly mitochondrial protein homolog n=1 Tax=Rhagoletis pomonella TaxID=28610 RepID=UPI00178575C4|nr:COX assembly mitochondrial protein homolog [Rhagoletis pomonella]